MTWRDASAGRTHRREMPFGRFEIVRLRGLAIGRATDPPGRSGSVHIRARVRAERRTMSLHFLGAEHYAK